MGPKGYHWVVSFNETLASLSSKVCAKARNQNTKSYLSPYCFSCPMILGQV